LFGWSVVLAAVLGVFGVVVDAWHRWEVPSEPYSWAGWYLVWPVGVYAAAALMLVWIVLKAAYRLLRRAVRRVIPQAKAA
jgi:hypothetical protein